MKKSLTTAEIDLLSLISNNLFEKQLPISDNPDWDTIYQEATAQAVIPITFSKLMDEHAPLPEELKIALKKSYYHNIANNMCVNYNHSFVHNLMKENNIPYVILKGCASASYYPNPLLRAMGDVDFLVKKSDMDKAGKALSDKGLETDEEKQSYHLEYKNDTMYLELHFEPPGVPEGNIGEIVRNYLEDIFSTGRDMDIVGNEMIIPDDFHHGLVILLHTCHHLTSGGVGLRHLCDWAVFSNHFSDDEFKTIFQERLEAIGMWRFAQLLTQLSIRFLGMDEKSWAMENVNEDLLEAMICDIFNRGNFGIKDENRAEETLFISHRGKNGNENNASLVKQFTTSMNNIVYMKWPVAKKLKILLPFGWIFYSVRYLIKIALGKRHKLHVGKVLAGAKERKEIYEQLHLFEV